MQALPKADQFGPAPDGEMLIGLRLSIEPRMLLQSVEKVTIRKAVDDQKQDLVQTATDVNPAGVLPGGAAPAPGGFGGPVILPFPGPGLGVSAGGIQQETAVHLKKGDKPSKSLSELSGTVTRHILAEAAPVITASEILKVKAGATFKGGENGELTIADVSKNANGQVVIRLQLRAAHRLRAGRRRRQPGRRPTRHQDPPSAAGSGPSPTAARRSSRAARGCRRHRHCSGGRRHRHRPRRLEHAGRRWA